MSKGARPNGIIERVEREAAVPGLAALLASLPAPDLSSLLLEVHRRRARQRSPARVLADHERDRLVQPSAVPPGRLLEWERAALRSLPAGFEPLALSPVCPLGTSSVVAGVSQDWAVATGRNTEVVSDATNVLALEAASRRRQLLRSDVRSAGPVHLAASHRLLRPQRPSGPHQLAHFGLFALASAGRDRGSWTFELEAIEAHLRFHISALRAFLGPGVSLRVSVGDLSGHDRFAAVEERLLSPLRAGFDNVEFRADTERTHGRGYYTGFCLHVHGLNREGEELFLADGGEVDWTRKLLGNAKERLVVSGVGSERVCTAFADDSRTSERRTVAP